jgi:hypothetical protein
MRGDLGERDSHQTQEWGASEGSVSKVLLGVNRNNRMDAGHQTVRPVRVLRESCFLLRGAFLLLLLLPFCFLVLLFCHLFLTLVLILLAAFVSHGMPPLLLSVMFSP